MRASGNAMTSSGTRGCGGPALPATTSKGPLNCLTFSADGRGLAGADYAGNIIVWDTATWEPTGKTMMLPGEVNSAVIGPNDQFFIQLSTGYTAGGNLSGGNVNIHN